MIALESGNCDFSMGCVVIALKTIFFLSIGSVEARFAFLSI